jgi:hypothetical protein
VLTFTNTDYFTVRSCKVNYFGRQDEVDQVEVAPILLKKGSTKVALYGLGSLRDERLNRMWERQKVRFLRPDSEDVDDETSEESEYFNIFTLHQNRDLGRGTKNCVHESMIPEWMDIVVWVSFLSAFSRFPFLHSTPCCLFFLGARTRVLDRVFRICGRDLSHYATRIERRDELGVW